MLEPHELPQPREVPNGWHFVNSGRAQDGDKFWVPHLRAFLPLVIGDMKVGVSIQCTDMPVIIRKGN